MMMMITALQQCAGGNPWPFVVVVLGAFAVFAWLGR